MEKLVSYNVRVITNSEVSGLAISYNHIFTVPTSGYFTVLLRVISVSFV